MLSRWEPLFSPDSLIVSDWQRSPFAFLFFRSFDSSLASERKSETQLCNNPHICFSYTTSSQYFNGERSLLVMEHYFRDEWIFTDIEMNVKRMDRWRERCLVFFIFPSRQALSKYLSMYLAAFSFHFSTEIDQNWLKLLRHDKKLRASERVCTKGRLDLWMCTRYLTRYLFKQKRISFFPPFL